MSEDKQTVEQIEHEFDSAEVPTENIRAMRPFSELLAKKTQEPPTEGKPEGTA